MKLVVGLDVNSEKLGSCLLTDDLAIPILKKTLSQTAL